MFGEAVLLLGCKHKLFEQFGRRDFGSISLAYIRSDIFDDIDDFLVGVELLLLLEIVTEDDRLAGNDMARVWLDSTQQQTDKRRFAHAIGTDDTDAFTLLELIRKITNQTLVAV